MNESSPQKPHVSEELLTRWIDGQLAPAEEEQMERLLAAQPELLQEKRSAEALGSLMRRGLPARMEPPSAEFFTSQIMEQIEREPAAAAQPKAATPQGGRGWFGWLRSAWAAPLATAAAVLVAGFFAIKAASNRDPASFERPYSPDPRVTATLEYSEEANATIIELQGLEAIPDETEVKAFNVASSEPGGPGEPQRFFAASDPQRLVFMLWPGREGAPNIREIH
jgi:hypothetical protein